MASLEDLNEIKFLIGNGLRKLGICPQLWNLIDYPNDTLRQKWEDQAFALTFTLFAGHLLYIMQLFPEYHIPGLPRFQSQLRVFWRYSPNMDDPDEFMLLAIKEFKEYATSVTYALGLPHSLDDTCQLSYNQKPIHSDTVDLEIGFVSEL